MMSENIMAIVNRKIMKKMDINRMLIILICCIFLSGCVEDEESINSVRAIGTYEVENVDKNIWGDFQLVLEIDKASYLYKDKILTSLSFNNIGTKSIKLICY
jgi:PBP1b-binding outer membrane lipoprotein LpoB